MNVNLCSSLNKLDGIIKGQFKVIKVFKVFKVLPSRQKYSDKNIVYEIQCRDYDATYVGQTRRLLKTRTKEHRNH